MRILFIGDVVGRAGRRMVRERLPGLRAEYGVDLVIANGENAAHGTGLTPETAEELWRAGVDVITLGNHVWEKKELLPLLESSPKLVRPYNWPAHPPGRGYTLVPCGPYRVAVACLLGRTFLPIHPDCPFRAADALVAQVRGQAHVLVIDFHAEATSEKQALAWYLDGRATAVLGTHTHVQTVDARVLPKGTATITDVGMTGPLDGVIGMEVGPVLQRFITQRPHRFEPASGRAVLSAVLVDVEPQTGTALGIRRIYLRERPSGTGIDAGPAIEE